MSVAYTMWSGKAEHRDDRARPRTFVSDRQLYEQVWGRPPARILIVPILGCCYFLAFFGSFLFPLRFGWIQLAPVVLTLFMGIAGSIYLWRYRPTKARTLQPMSAYLLAHGICGSCGYSLLSSAVEEDGCVVCPECGGAWHHHRFVWAAKQPQPALPYLQNYVMGHGALSARVRDHRGVPLSSRYRWPPAWIEQRLKDTQALASVDHLRSAKLKAYLLLWLPPYVASLFVLLCALVMLTFEGWRAEDLLDVSLVALPFIVFGAMLLWRIRREQALERWAIDTAARCYNCGEPLPLDIPAGFDGCFTCGACGHAWKQSTKQESNSLIWSMEL